jgi:hypothetical protein
MLARCMDVRRRRIAVIVVGCALALATLPAVLADSSPAPSVPAVTSTAPDYTPSAAGEQFAAQVLASAPLPPGAQEWTATPPAVLATPMQSIGVSGLIDIHELYLVDEPASPALSNPLNGYVRAHLPAGSKEMGGGSMFGPSGDATGFFLSLPTSGPSQSLAMLLYATTATSGGQYVLRVDAQVVWVPDRSSSEAIPPPAGAQLTGFATLSAANPSSGPVSVQLGEADSARLAAAVNALPLAPGTFCMEDSLLFTITFQPPPFSSSPSYSVSEDLCGATVYVSVGATHLPALSDTGCSLGHLVAGLLPARAAGTRSAAADC